MDRVVGGSEAEYSAGNFFRTKVVPSPPRGKELGYGVKVLKVCYPKGRTISYLAVQCLFGPLPLSLLFVFAGSLGAPKAAPPSPSPPPPPLRTKREVGGQRRKRMSEGKTDRQTDSVRRGGSQKNSSIIRGTHSLSLRDCQTATQ